MPDKKEEDVLHPNGVFDPLLRFAFTNVSSEDFKSFWNGRPVTVKAGDTVKLTHHLAVKFLKELVDQIIIGEAKLDETNFYKNNPNALVNTYRSKKGLDLGIPAKRKEWEDKIIKQLPMEQDALQLEIMRSEFIETLSNDLKKEPSKEPVSVPSASLSGGDKMPEVFAEIK